MWGNTLSSASAWWCWVPCKPLVIVASLFLMQANLFAPQAGIRWSALTRYTVLFSYYLKTCALFGKLLAIMEITCLSDKLSAFCHICMLYTSVPTLCSLNFSSNLRLVVHPHCGHGFLSIQEHQVLNLTLYQQAFIQFSSKSQIQMGHYIHVHFTAAFRQAEEDNTGNTAKIDGHLGKKIRFCRYLLTKRPFTQVI